MNPPKQKSIQNKKILITGGLGFIGFNAALRFSKSNDVTVIDDKSRLGVDNNIKKLQNENVRWAHIDISQFEKLKEVLNDFQPDVIVHMAAQVAVTLSIADPLRDYASNLQGSFNLLELARHAQKKPIILYASTNKVYGGKVEEAALKNGRYVSKNPLGYSEEAQLSFETPYGCSKGAADQYMLDYYRTYKIPTVVFRQSCIYGPNQYGLEDQGWVAWFSICSLLQKPLTIFGDGCQVRDVLYVDDLIDLYEKAIQNIESVKGEAFNVGGGALNTLSLNELLKILEKKLQKPLKVSYTDWRLGDQKVFISDIRKAKRLLGWKPTVAPEKGVEKLLGWVEHNRKDIEKIIAKLP